MNEHLREEEFVSYVDGRLPAAERARAEAHLKSCADCRAQVERLGAVLGVLNEWTPAAVSPGFDARLRERLAGERERRGWFGLRPAYVAALALAVLAVVGSGVWHSTTTAPSTPAQVAVNTSTPAATSATATSDELAVVDNPVLLQDYELLENFDVLFESNAQEEEKKKL